MLYGTHGIGKSTWGAQAPRPIFIQTEDGLGEIDCERFPLAESFEEVIDALSELYSEKHTFKTVVIDSLDWLERLIWAEVCCKRMVESIEDIGYAKGYTFALTQWRACLDGLSTLRSERAMTVILIAHAKIERFENPETESYDRYVPRLHKLASAVVQEWCDEVLFATYRVYTKVTDESFNRKKAKGLGSGERIVHTGERPAHVAKNRLGLPDEMPLERTMAELNNFNAHDVDPAVEFEAIPAGKYLAVITQSEMKPTKSQNGSYLELVFEVIEGECKGRLLWSRLNLENPNPLAVKIARSELSAICRAVGVMTPRDSIELHNLPLVVSVKCKKREDTGEIANEIKGYARREAVTAEPQQAASDVPLWARK